MSNKKVSISISEDFTDAPGARYYDDGEKSGEEFLERLLIPRFQDALDRKLRLSIDLDGTWGYASSFISGSFGELSRKYGVERVLETIDFISEEDPDLVGTIIDEIKNPTYKERKRK